MTEITLAMSVAWWVGVYHMMIGSYLVFISERRTPFVLVTGLVKGLLGTLVYLVVRDPPWVITHIPWIADTVMLLTLIVMFVFSVIVTILIWRAFDLVPPNDRFKELGNCAMEWWSSHRRRF